MSTPNQCIKLTFVIWLRDVIMTLENELRYHIVIYLPLGWTQSILRYICTYDISLMQSAV